MGNLRFGEVYTKDLDLIIQAPPVYAFPEKDVSIEHIPGRNGDLVIDNKCWKNVERTYNIASVFRPGSNFIDNAEKLIKFLTANKGYCRLEDSYDPLVYRMAMFKDGGELPNLYDEATAINVTFNCKPQRYLKEGDDPIYFKGSSARLENITNQKSLPIINIKNIIKDPNDKDILLVTVKNIDTNNEETVTSTLTISNMPSGDLIIDSALQTVYSEKLGDANKYVNLNDTQFPELGTNLTDILINKYQEKETTLNNYDSIMNNNRKDCLALYKPFNSIVESKQKSIYIKSYNILKQQMSEVYEAEPYATYCLESAEEYIIASYNSILDETGMAYSFQGEASGAPSWLQISDAGNEEILVKVGSLEDLKAAGYSSVCAYFISNSDKKIRKLTPGETIGKFKNYSTTTVKIYPADSNTGLLAADYSDYDLPKWLTFKVNYDDQSSPISVEYITNSTGYFFLPKSGLFGKEHWEYCNANKSLTKLDWSSYKKAFMPTGISSSATATFKYSYLSDAPSYKNTMKESLDKEGNPIKDANGNPVMEIDNAVHFTVEVQGNDLTKVVYKAKDPGYFRCNDADQGTEWKYLETGDLLQDSIKINKDVKKSNIIYFLKAKPDYTNTENFPDWLDPIPVLYNSDNIIISESEKNITPHHIDFKVKKDAWYRFTYPDTDNKSTRYTKWSYIQNGTIMGNLDAPTVRNQDTNCTVYELDGKESEFPIIEYKYSDGTNEIKDVAFMYIDDAGLEVGYPNNIPPSWIKVNILPGEKADGSDTKLKFVTNSKGSYKWDSNTVWINKESGNEIVTSGRSDDTRIHYLSSMPSFDGGPLYNCNVKYNYKTGNPESVTVTAKKDGYYKPKNSSNWKYFKTNDEICESKITETTIIKNLEISGDQLNQLEISVTPRWWLL